MPGISRFATGLNADPAVAAGLSLPLSSGRVEGNVNRIKMIKRQMYGRADFDLLRKRVLLAAEERLSRLITATLRGWRRVRRMLTAGSLHGAIGRQ